MMTTATGIITIVCGALRIIIIYIVHCRVPYRRHTRNCVETRQQYQNIVRVVGAGGGSSILSRTNMIYKLTMIKINITTIIL